MTANNNQHSSQLIAQNLAKYLRCNNLSEWGSLAAKSFPRKNTAMLQVIESK